MKCYLCSVGQKTTQICKEQLEKFGFKVVMLDEVESWKDKYLRFLTLADDHCIRIDADIIPNENIQKLTEVYCLMAQGTGWDIYKNNVGVIGILYYSKPAIEIIKKNLDNIDWRRPEATAWRILEINKMAHTVEIPMGIHGLRATKEEIERHKKNKIDRKQIEDYNFELANKLLSL